MTGRQPLTLNRQNRSVGYDTRPASAPALARALALARAPDHLQGTTTA